MKMNGSSQDKRYILTLIETQSDRAFSTFLSRTRMTSIGSGIVALFLAMAFILSQVFHRIQVNHEMRKVQNENLVLIQTFKVWEQRTHDLEGMLAELTHKTQQIQHLTTFSTPRIEFGVGGRNTEPSVTPAETPEVMNTETNLLKLETELDWLKKSMAELEKSVSSRKDEIANLPSIRPVRRGWISSRFGQRIDPFTEELVDHPGIDISIQIGSEVFSAAAGVVKEIRKTAIPNKGYGKFVLIEHGLS